MIAKLNEILIKLFYFSLQKLFTCYLLLIHKLIYRLGPQVAKAELNFEETASYFLKVKVTDSGSPPMSSEKDVQIVVQNRNDPPFNLQLSCKYLSSSIGWLEVKLGYNIVCSYVGQPGYTLHFIFQVSPDLISQFPKYFNSEVNKMTVIFNHCNFRYYLSSAGCGYLYICLDIGVLSIVATPFNLQL